jgi:hypothetical protein
MVPPPARISAMPDCASVELLHPPEAQLIGEEVEQVCHSH